MLARASAVEDAALAPGASPKEAVIKWLEAMQSERDTEKIFDSSLVAVSPYCPSEKLESYANTINNFRKNITSHVIDKNSDETIRINRFAGVVMRLSEPGKPLARIVVGVTALKTAEGWKVPVGMQHFDNVFYGFDKQLRKEQADVTQQLIALKRKTSLESDSQTSKKMLTTLRKTREELQLDALEPEQLAQKFVYPKTPLTDIERLSYLAIAENPSATDLRMALEMAGDINRNTSAIRQLSNAEKMAGILELRAKANRRGLAVGQAEVKPAEKNQPANLAKDKIFPRPIAEMPWPADAVGTRRFRQPGAIALMLPQSIRKEFGDLPEPFIEIVEKFVSDDGEHMVISFGLFDQVIPGRFAVLPIYLRKTDAKWAITLPDSIIFQSPDSREQSGGAILAPNDDLLEWYYENDLDHLDKFSNSVVAFADKAGQTPKYQSPGDLVKAYLEAVKERDLLRCLRLTASRTKAFSKDLQDLLTAIQHSYEILDPEVFEIHPANPKYAVQNNDSAAMLWLTRISRSSPGVIVANAVITENAGDGDGWKVSPGIHEVFPISSNPNTGERKTLPLNEKQAKTLARLDQLRIAKEEEVRDACVADLFDRSIIIDKLSPLTINPAPVPSLPEAQAIVEELANHHTKGDVIDLMKISSSLKTENPKDYYRVLRDIGNDRAFFREVGNHLEAIGAHTKGRWLGVIVRDSRMPDRVEKVDSPTTKDTLSMRLFIRYNNRWLPLLGASLLKEINGGMKWINRRLISTISKVIGDEEISDIKALKVILDETPSVATEPADTAE